MILHREKMRKRAIYFDMLATEEKGLHLDALSRYKSFLWFYRHFSQVIVGVVFSINMLESGSRGRGLETLHLMDIINPKKNIMALGTLINQHRCQYIISQDSSLFYIPFLC